MKYTDIAPLVRGAIIEKTGAPCVVCPSTSRAPADLTITVSDEADDATLAATCTKAVRSYQGSPAIITVQTANTESFTFCVAPTYASLQGGKAASIEAQAYPAIKGRLACVTGGAQGFGEELVRGLVQAGATVFIADVNAEGARRLADELNASAKGMVALSASCNVADEDSVSALIDSIIGTVGGLDLFVSNAGILRAQSALEQDIASFRLVTEINYTAFAIVAKHFGRLARLQSLTSPSWFTDLIQVNSKSGLDGSNKNASYAGSKFGSIGLVQSFAKELITYNLKVNAICPGNFFEGPLWMDAEKGLFVQYLRTGKVPGAKTVADVKAFYEAKVPMGRGCRGEDVLRALFYLVEQQYETGQALPVTGGQVMLH